MSTRAETIRALRAERSMLASMGRTSRVAQIDAELARFDASPDTQTLEAAVPGGPKRTRVRTKPNR